MRPEADTKDGVLAAASGVGGQRDNISVAERCPGPIAGLLQTDLCAARKTQSCTVSTPSLDVPGATSNDATAGMVFPGLISTAIDSIHMAAELLALNCLSPIWSF